MKIGVIGCGKMGTALVAGAIRSKAIEAADVLGFDPHGPAAEAFHQATTAVTVEQAEALHSCEVLLLCTKPHHAAAALNALPPQYSGLIISIVAGQSIDWLSKHSPSGCRVIRCMPNTPALVGEGATGFALSASATTADADFARGLLGSVGVAIEVPESQLDAVTGLSGSGPAFVFMVIEALADGGVRAGLPRAHALQLATQTVRGAARMVAETGLHPGELRDQVASPGGTTIAGIAELEKGGLRAALIQAVTAAAHRSIELGRD
jgi:pyrroline-5-carboxylate reductase